MPDYEQRQVVFSLSILYVLAIEKFIFIYVLTIKRALIFIKAHISRQAVFSLSVLLLSFEILKTKVVHIHIPNSRRALDTHEIFLLHLTNE